MSIIGYSICAAIVCALIDYCRIDVVKGDVVNIKKSYTVLIGGVFCFIGMLLFCVHPGTSLLEFIIEGLVFSLFFTSVRGVVYDPTLNKFRRLKIDYESATTNSKIDGGETSIGLGFWKQRGIYLIASIFFYLIFKLITA